MCLLIPKIERQQDPQSFQQLQCKQYSSEPREHYIFMKHSNYIKSNSCLIMYANGDNPNLLVFFLFSKYKIYTTS